MTAIINTTTAKTAELVAFWNAHCATVELNPVKKFQDRATAEARVISLIEKLDEIETDEVEAAGTEEVAEEEVVEESNGHTNGNGAVFGNLCDSIASASSKANEKKPNAIPARNRASNSEGIAASWQRPDVAAARLTRHGVEVKHGKTVEVFKSTAAAFRELRLEMNRHIRFRLQLKENGTATYVDSRDNKSYEFTLVEISDESDE